MPKYMIEGSYTAEGLKGLYKDKSTGRTAAIKAAVKSAGGKLETLYWCLGDADAIVIADFPDTPGAAAFALAASASGMVRTKTTVLLTAAELDKALGSKVGYRAPGK